MTQRIQRISFPRLASAWVVILVAWMQMCVYTPASALTFANTRMSYQGQLFIADNPVDGPVEMKFVIYDPADVETLWSHDGSSGAGGEPTSSITVDVTDGLFSIILGAPPQNTIDPEPFRGAKDPQLRIWIENSGDFDKMPDQPIRSTAVAMTSHSADVALGDFEAEGEVWSKSGGFKFPDGTVQTSAALGGGGGGTLDDAYDNGGAGQGRTITADAGAVAVVGPDGLAVDGGELTVGPASDPEIRLDGDVGRVYLNRIKASGGLDIVQLESSLWFYDGSGTLYGGLTTLGDLVLGGSGIGGSIQLNGDAGANVINLNADTGTISTGVLEITGGSDLAEPFAMAGGRTLPEGSVVVIDPASPGTLTLSRAPYDRRVAGVVSGAGGVNAGLTLNQEGLLGGGQNVALTGRVYVRADASSASIQPGDLLTTSARPGHAMKATDRARSHGAIVGKAMSTLEDGTGLVLVLVNLQ